MLRARAYEAYTDGRYLDAVDDYSAAREAYRTIRGPLWQEDVKTMTELLDLCVSKV